MGIEKGRILENEFTSVSKSDEEMEEMVGEDGGSTNSEAGSSISVVRGQLFWGKVRFGESGYAVNYSSKAKNDKR